MTCNDDYKDEISFSVLITKQCNFECSHCMYECGPNVKSGFVSDDVLGQIKKQIRQLVKDGYPTSINLIGGEPTLNFTEFERVLKWAIGVQELYGTSVEMTTNGWWLKSDATIKRFLEIIARNVYHFGMENGFQVRISNDQWHDQFRPHWLQGTQALKNALEGIWQLESTVFYDYETECPYCESDFIDEYYCEECDHHAEWVDVFDYRHPPNPFDKNYETEHWIYIDSPTTLNQVIPVGKGGYWICGGNDKGGRGRCDVGRHLGYAPDGTLKDICCSGSNLPVGTCADDPRELLKHAVRFREWVRKDGSTSCWDCAHMAQKYIESLDIIS